MARSSVYAAARRAYMHEAYRARYLVRHSACGDGATPSEYPHWLIVSVNRPTPQPSTYRVLPWPTIPISTLPAGTLVQMASYTSGGMSIVGTIFGQLLITDPTGSRWNCSAKDIRHLTKWLPVIRSVKVVEPFPRLCEKPMAQMRLTSQCSGTSPSHSTPEGL